MAASGEFDIAIIGAGPAGLAAAITLGRYSGLRVALIERDLDKPYHAGELIPAGAWPLLEYLHIAEILEQRQAAQTCTLLGSWTTGELLAHETPAFAASSHYALNRHILNETLIGEAKRLGITVWNRRFARCFQSGDSCGWRIACDESGKGAEMRARFIIDASGRRAIVARKLAKRRRLDTMIAVVDAHLSPKPFTGPAAARIEAATDGWWYQVELSGCGATTMFLTDRDTLQRSRMTDPGVWSESLHRTDHIVRRPAPGRLIAVSAASASTELASGADWIAVGEAAAAYDPISSLGIGYGLLSGIEGARCVMSALNGETESLAGYSRSIQRHFADYLTNRRRIYSAQRRWSDVPFWRERAG